jgi:hypothetical protein
LSDKPLSEDKIQYWANQPIGGSGLSISIQTALKSMAIEILKHRGIALDENGFNKFQK